MLPPYGTQVGGITPWMCCGRTPNTSLAECCKTMPRAIGTRSHHPHRRRASAIRDHKSSRTRIRTQYFDGAWALRPVELVSFSVKILNP